MEQGQEEERGSQKRTEVVEEVSCLENGGSYDLEGKVLQREGGILQVIGPHDRVFAAS